MIANRSKRAFKYCCLRHITCLPVCVREFRGSFGRGRVNKRQENEVRVTYGKIYYEIPNRRVSLSRLTIYLSLLPIWVQTREERRLLDILHSLSHFPTMVRIFCLHHNLYFSALKTAQRPSPFSSMVDPNSYFLWPLNCGDVVMSVPCNWNSCLPVCQLPVRKLK